MISSIVLTFAKSSLNRYLVLPYNFQISLLCFLPQASPLAHRIFFHKTLSTYHGILYMMPDLDYPKVFLLSFVNYLLTLRSTTYRVYSIPLHLIGIFQVSLYWIQVLGSDKIYKRYSGMF